MPEALSTVTTSSSCSARGPAMRTMGTRRATAAALARQRPSPPRVRLATGAERQQQRAPGAPQHGLGGVHDLVHEQNAAALDVDLVHAALKGDQANDVLTPRGPPLRSTVWHESELLNHLNDALARFRVNKIGAAHDT